MHEMGVDAPNADSGLALFLKGLVEEGRALVTPKPLTDDGVLSIIALKQLDKHARNELALDAPTLSVPAALWAARLFYHLCLFTVCREISEEQVANVCAENCPEPRNPETDWSADLVFRHLPQLFRSARHLSSGDPLVQQIKLIAATWPLSSVGIPELTELRIDSFINHPALRRLYVDRISAASDLARLDDPRVADQLRMDISIHHELAPLIANRIFETTA